MPPRPHRRDETTNPIPKTVGSRGSAPNDSRGQSPQIMATDMGELTGLLGACLDMPLAITAGLTGRMPVTLCGILDGVQQSFDDLEIFAERQLGEVERRAAQLDRLRGKKRAELIAEAGCLVEEAQKPARSHRRNAGDTRSRS